MNFPIHIAPDSLRQFDDAFARVMTALGSVYSPPIARADVAEFAQVHNLDWISSFGIALNEDTFAKYRNIDCGGLSSLAFPYGSREFVALGADVIGWLFLFDDFYGEARLIQDLDKLAVFFESVALAAASGDPSAGLKTTDSVGGEGGGRGSAEHPTPFDLNAFHAPPFDLTPFHQAPFDLTAFHQSPFHLSPFHESVADLSRRAAAFAGKSWCGQWADSLRQYFFGCIQELKVQRSGRPLTVAEHHQIREFSIGMYSVFDFIEAALAPDNSFEPYRQHPLIKAARKSGAYVCAWVNDFFSMKKEWLQNDENNIIFLIAREKNTSFADAVELAVSLHQQDLTILSSTIDSLKSEFGCGSLPHLYGRAIFEWAAGNFIWSSQTRRYHAPVIDAPDLRNSSMPFVPCVAPQNAIQ